LVSPIADYAHYQQQQAWTWEHQALVRGRFVAGDVRLKAAFEAVRHATLCAARPIAALKTEVCEMRQKMRAALAPASDAVFDVKHSVGGMVDFEFMVQCAVLAHSAAYPALTQFTDNMRLLDSLAQCGLWAGEDVSRLKAIYAAYRDYGHKQVLQGEKACTETPRFALEAAFVEQQWQRLMESDR
jgi:glutamate-ammonia-ligase adenylyltransferase